MNMRIEIKMRWLINYIRSCFCKHEWELIFDTTVFREANDEIPIRYEKVYRCKKCGVSKKYKG